MKNAARSWCRLGVAASLTVLLVACGGGGGGGGGDSGTTATIAGQLSISSVGAAPAGPVLEAEPNGSPDTAHRLGEIEAGDTIVVHGHCDADSDAIDGYDLVAPARVRVTATLEFPDVGGNDFDLGVFDPVTFNYGEVFVATTAPEVGTFYAKGTFNLVVSAYAGSGEYVLTIEISAASQPIAEREPDTDDPLEALFLGEMRVGDTVVIAGTADSVTDGYEGVSVTVPDGIRLNASVSFPGGEDFDIQISDITTTFTTPPLIGVFDSGVANPETGFVDVPAGRMLWVEVIAFSGFGAWTLTLQANASPLQTPASANAAEGRVASLALEASVWKHGREDLCYGRIARPIVPGDVLLRVESVSTGRRAMRAAVAPEAQSLRFGGGEHACASLGSPAGLDAEELQRWTFARSVAVSGRPGVRYAEPNYRVEAFAEPDDTHYNLQWHYDLINLEAAWDLTTGSSDVIVAVIDTGVGFHSDLDPRLIGGYDVISVPSISSDGDGADADPTDVGDRANPDGSSSFHGTHVAGTIGAETNNGSSVSGVTWATRIMPIRALGVGGGTTQDIVTAVRYAARLPNATGTLPPERADVINMSLGGGGYTQSMQDAVDAARAAGVVIIAAAGNNGTSVLQYPASYAGVVSVSAVGADATLAPYSSYGTEVDIAAPGGNLSVDRNGDGYPDGVLSTMLFDGALPITEGALFSQGTSMAAPHVAGVACLMLAVNPTLTPDQVEAILTGTAQDLGAPGPDNFYGAGLVDAYAAVRFAEGLVGGDPALILGSDALGFGSTLGVLTTAVSNGGGGQLQVTGTSVVTQDGAAWLSATTVGTGNASRNVDGIRVEVDRTGLPLGSYSGRVTVSSDGGTDDVQVLMTVSSPTAAPTAPIYVLAIDVDSGETVEEVVVDPTVATDFTLASLAPGTYLIAAGTDLDDDGFICDEGESCGVYPVSGEPIYVTVEAGEVVTGVDFSVVPVGVVVAAAGAEDSGYARRRPGDATGRRGDRRD